ncbi:MAG: methyltransferase domain-containing protein [Alphaproteobacteria bacterium]|nr:methyltransferase domain-containing protein [Alphaproteobacteria bacterium]
MSGALFSSGDPAVDRRADFAETLASTGDWSGAIEVLSGALDLAPRWAAGWYRLGELHEMAGQTDGAVRAFDVALALNPADPFGASLKRSLLLDAPGADSMPAAFVELLFDQYAPQFERALVEGLKYRGPDLLLEALKADGFVYAACVLDLGCGTGLMGEALRPFCVRLEGVDLSAGMLAKARAKSVYDQLDKADIASLTLEGPRYDLIVAADVFIYLGALEHVISWSANSLQPGGRLAFTVELSETGDIELRDSRRFAHSRAYIASLLEQAGFTGVKLQDCVLRADRGCDIASLVVTACAPAASFERTRDGEDEAAS